MFKIWTRRHLLIEDIPNSVKQEGLLAFINNMQKVEQLEYIYESFMGQKIFLHAAVVLFQDNVNVNLFPDDTKLIYKEKKLRTYHDLEERINHQAFLYGIDSKTTEDDIRNMYRKFRVTTIKIYPFEKQFHSYAMLYFKKARDRDACMIYANHFHNWNLYFFPNENQVLKLNSLTTDIEVTKDDPKVTFKFDRFELHANLKRFSSIAKNVLESSSINDFPGDHDMFLKYIDGNEIIVSPNQIPFLKSIGNYFKINQLSELRLTPFINFDNIIYFLNICQSKKELGEIINFIGSEYARLTHNGRIRNIPAAYLTELIEKLPAPGLTEKHIFKLYMQNTRENDNPTPLLKKIDFDSLKVSEVSKIVMDKRVSINDFHDQIVSLTNKKVDIQQFLTVQYDPERPLNGVFSFIFERDGANNFKNAVQAEASSTIKTEPTNNTGDVYCIIDPKSGNYFSSKTVPQQWVKFTFAHEELQLSHYSIQRADMSSPFIKSWDLSGTKDGINWVVLDSVSNSTALSKPSSIITRPIPKSDFYKSFKIDHTGTNSRGYDTLILQKVEFFGALREQEQD
ncbi:hypothetical protein TVAG_295670 [Trichomonas vaginalis G3]|uniref:F5/8 type C domain-containing protein n=1 Tax=Trichomonas vaginalis (strain ATCC PRA-98 / G3) TaxID=412133 RepID=A2F234_TRIV3|nr:protein ubiquitination [Trichomonas vaginalis G3]EAY01033.1 hypothetical protein TVAG_295670 [Trichomonas vaginalis G3]KAI5488628.1 protein ubiquitination [Trichomonas vaginalis G3]|eukprot:XP_001313919.1 hypothetical protein [Trichomonas vaginalis G3]